MSNPILLENMEWIAKELEAETERQLKIAEDYNQQEKKKLKIRSWKSPLRWTTLKTPKR